MKHFLLEAVFLSVYLLTLLEKGIQHNILYMIQFQIFKQCETLLLYLVNARGVRSLKEKLLVNLF